MILVEHAVVVSIDPALRIFPDGSVLIDGERIAQVGRATDILTPRAPERVLEMATLHGARSGMRMRSARSSRASAPTW